MEVMGGYHDSKSTGNWVYATGTREKAGPGIFETLA